MKLSGIFEGILNPDQKTKTTRVFKKQFFCTNVFEDLVQSSGFRSLILSDKIVVKTRIECQKNEKFRIFRWLH